MCDHHNHNPRVVEHLPKEQARKFVLCENGLQEFFDSEVSHLERRRYHFSVVQRALASGQLAVGPKVMQQLRDDVAKNNAFFTWVKMAAINGVKEASRLMPFSCTSNLEEIKARVTLDEKHHTVNVYCYVAAFENRPVETEAMAGVNTGLLAVYDHYKYMDPSLALGGSQLLFKEDGHEGLWFNPQGIPADVQSVFRTPIQFFKGLKVALISISDKAVGGNLSDAGQLLQMRVEELGGEVVDYKLLMSDEKTITDYVKKIVNEKSPHLVMMRGAVGISPYDKTPFATKAICERMIPGLAEMLRIFGSRYTSGAWNACCEAGVLNKTLVISLPGARKAIDEVMQILPPTLADAICHIRETSLMADHANEVEDDYRIWT